MHNLESVIFWRYAQKEMSAWSRRVSQEALDRPLSPNLLIEEICKRGCGQKVHLAMHHLRMHNLGMHILAPRS